MSAETLLSLAERCEQEGPSRELDFQIDAHATPVHSNNEAPILRYTTSLDAAVGLIPETFEWAIRTIEGPFRGSVWRHDPYFCAIEADARTAALALCAAALRARAALEN